MADMPPDSKANNRGVNMDRKLSILSAIIIALLIISVISGYFAMAVKKGPEVQPSSAVSGRDLKAQDYLDPGYSGLGGTVVSERDFAGVKALMAKVPRRVPDEREVFMFCRHYPQYKVQPRTFRECFEPLFAERDFIMTKRRLERNKASFGTRPGEISDEDVFCAMKTDNAIIGFRIWVKVAQPANP